MDFLSRTEIDAQQLERLRTLLSAIHGANPFYTRKLGPAGDPAQLHSLADFAAKVPFTTKAELSEDQRAHPPYGTNLTFPLERYTRCHQTSGSTGAPLRWLDTPDSWEWMLRSWLEVYRAAGTTAKDRVFFAFSFGPFIGFWLAFEAAARLGCLCLPGGGLSSAARLRMILDHGATVLCSTPTYAMRLAEVAAAEGIDLKASRVKTLLVAGEPGGSIPATRARLAQLWPGARVFDHHGMTEVGPVTHECPARPGVLHVIEPAYLAEVIDPQTGQAAPLGQPGELVLTTLGRTGSPLLRYRTGDLVKLALPAPAAAPTTAPPHPSSLAPHALAVPCVPAPCACGRSTTALEGGILGRADDMVVVRGVNVFPSAVEEILRAGGEVAEYQVRISTRATLPEMTIHVEPAPTCGDPRALVRRLETALQHALALRVPVKVEPPGALPRFELKARRWVRE
jgi:phenylacetate-CoA ligase